MIQLQVQGYHILIVFSVKAKEIRYMMTGVTRFQLERAKVGLQLSSWYLQLTTINRIVDDVQYVFMVTNIARVWINRIRLPILLVVS